MSYNLRRYHTLGIHPVTAYAADDFQIAYLANGEGRDTEIYARKVVSRLTKDQAPKGYGNNHLITELLKLAGYQEHSNSRTPNLIKRIMHPTDHGYIVGPYIDSKACVSSTEVYSSSEYLHVTNQGSVQCRAVSGAPAVSPCTHCHGCGSIVPLSYVAYQRGEWRMYCQTCKPQCNICNVETPVISKYWTVPLENYFPNLSIVQIKDRNKHLVAIATCANCAKAHGGTKVV